MVRRRRRRLNDTLLEIQNLFYLSCHMQEPTATSEELKFSQPYEGRLRCDAMHVVDKYKRLEGTCFLYLKRRSERGGELLQISKNNP
jgi:hypothetical protein